MATSSLPKTIRAIRQLDKNSDKIELVSTPLPVPSHPEDILVKVAATAPCLGELWWARDFPSLIPADKELIPGQDLAGTVVSAPATSPFKTGDEVFARIEAGRPGAGREYTLARQSELALKPKSLDWIQTAATPLSALTAWQAVFVEGSLEAAAVSGDAEARKRNQAKRILITGAGGSVGGWAVEFAAAAGAGAIVALNGGPKVKQVLELGATEVIDYTKTTVDAWANENPAEREVDLIVDCVGGATLKTLWSAIKEGGVFISIRGGPDDSRPEGNTKKLAKSAFFVVKPLGSQLTEIARLIDQGSFKPLVDSVYEFEQFQEAFDKVDGGHTNGKVIIKISI